MLVPAPAMSPASLKLSTAPFFHRVSGQKRKHLTEGAHTVPQWRAPSLATCPHDSSAWGLGCECRKYTSELGSGCECRKYTSRETRSGQSTDPVILRPSQPLPNVPAARGHVQMAATLESPDHGLRGLSNSAAPAGLASTRKRLFYFYFSLCVY